MISKGGGYYSRATANGAGTIYERQDKNKDHTDREIQEQKKLNRCILKNCCICTINNRSRLVTTLRTYTAKKHFLFLFFMIM